MHRPASIDIGSQTIRVLVASIDGYGKLSPVYRNRAIIRLGEDMHLNSGALRPEAIERAVTCIKAFIDEARFHGATSIFPVCTACVRNASNASEFLEKVNKKTGIMPRVISGEQEARLSLRGIVSALPEAITQKPLLIIDIGGGSTEFAYLKDNTLCTTVSIQLGVIQLTEQYIHNDPPTQGELATLTREIRKRLTHVPLLDHARNDGCTLAGTAGTVTTLAAMDLRMMEYDPNFINGHQLTLKSVTALWNLLTTLPFSERRHLPGLEAGRETVIISGTAVLRDIMHSTGADHIMVSDAGLLEGILLEHIADQKNASATFS